VTLREWRKPIVHSGLYWLLFTVMVSQVCQSVQSLICELLRVMHMIWYKHYIGDFQRDTSHLTMTERGAYLALIQHYYANEECLPSDHSMLCRIAGAMTKIEKDAVMVAMGFFEHKPEGLWHKRIEAELEKTDGKRDTNKKIALEREARKRAERLAAQQTDSTNRARNVDETLHETSTMSEVRHQTSNKNTLPAKAVSIVKQSNDMVMLSGIDNLPAQVAEDFLKVRKAKRSPLTATALALIEREAVKAGLTTAQAIAIAAARGWQSFKADWIADNDGKTTAERTQDFKDRQAEKAYAPLLQADKETLKAWGLDQ